MHTRVSESRSPTAISLAPSGIISYKAKTL